MKPIVYTQAQQHQRLLEIAEDLKLSIKKVKYHPSRNGEGMSASIYQNNKEFANVIDEGNGGMYRFDASGTIEDSPNNYWDNLKTLDGIRAHLRNFPKHVVRSEHIEHTFETQISFEDVIIALEEQRRELIECKKGITFKEKGGTMKMVSWKGGNLERLIKKGSKQLIQKKIDSLIEQESVILHTDYLTKLGFEL